MTAEGMTPAELRSLLFRANTGSLEPEDGVRLAAAYVAADQQLGRASRVLTKRTAERDQARAELATAKSVVLKMFGVEP